MKLKKWNQFNSTNESIYQANWKEEFNKVRCDIFDLEVGHSFNIDNYKDTLYYKGRKDGVIYFEMYKGSDVIYKITKDELKSHFVGNSNIQCDCNQNEGNVNSNLQDDISDLITTEYEKVDEIEIVQITGVISEEEAKKIDENFVVHAGDFSGKEIKRGDTVWLSCLMKKPGLSYAPAQQGVLKTRVTDIFMGLTKLNQIMK